MIRTKTTFAMALAPLLLAGSAIGQADAPDPADVLRGPTVEQRDVPGVQPSMTMQSQSVAERLAENIRPRQFGRAIQSLMGGDADPSLRLNPEQAETIDAVRKDMDQMRRTYNQGNREQIQSIRERLGPAFEELRNGNRREVLSSLNEDQVAAANELRAIGEGAPKPDDHYVRIWEVLDDAQRAHVNAYLENQRESQRENRGDRVAQTQPTPLTTDEAKARIDALPPAQQRFVLNQLRRVIEQAEQSAQRQDAPDVDADDLRAMLRDAG